MASILDEIIAHKQNELHNRRQQVAIEQLKEQAAGMPPCRDFAAALRREPGGPLKLLAEIKAASPSSGPIRADFDAGNVARLFEQSGAAAISVLTDTRYFAGTDEHLRQAKAAVSVPVLRKDFTIDEYQLYEARCIGADAILLMAQVLPPDRFSALHKKAAELGLWVLAEGHHPHQLDFIASMGAPVVGINNRDFDTMQVDLETTLQNRRRIPPDRVLVSQSGIFTREEARRVDAAGVDAIQVGTSIMQSSDMQGHINALLGI